MEIAIVRRFLKSGWTRGLLAIFLHPLTLSAAESAKPGKVQLQKSLSDSRVIMVTEGDSEAASIGSYTIRLFDNANGILDFVAGLLMPRDGSVHALFPIKMGSPERHAVLVTQVSAGSGSYVTAHTFEILKDRVCYLGTLGEDIAPKPKVEGRSAFSGLPESEIEKIFVGAAKKKFGKKSVRKKQCGIIDSDL